MTDPAPPPGSDPPGSDPPGSDPPGSDPTPRESAAPPAGAVRAAGLDALDLDSLTQMVDALDPETAASLVDGFVAEMVDRARRLAAAAEAADLEALAREGHALKSSAGTYGARELHGLASSIERSAKAGDRDRAVADAAQAPAAAARAADGFATWKARLADGG